MGGLVCRKEENMNFADANANALIAFGIFLIVFLLAYIAFERPKKVGR